MCASPRKSKYGIDIFSLKHTVVGVICTIFAIEGGPPCAERSSWRYVCQLKRVTNSLHRFSVVSISPLLNRLTVFLAAEIWRLDGSITLVLCYFTTYSHMGVSINGGTPKSSILVGFPLMNHPFWDTPIYGNPHMFPTSSKFTSKLFFQVSPMDFRICFPVFVPKQRFPKATPNHLYLETWSKISHFSHFGVLPFMEIPTRWYKPT